MKQQATTRFSPSELVDAKKKLRLYLAKLLVPSPHTKLQKICHLASETFLKFADNDEFSKQIYSEVKALILDKRCYFGLYLLDILLKNHKMFIKCAKKELDSFFKAIYEKVILQPKNSYKLECLKAMARTWTIIYGEKYEENIKKWLQNNHKDNLTLSDKNQDIFKESYEKYRSNNKNNMSQISINYLMKEINRPQENIQLLDALKN